MDYFCYIYSSGSTAPYLEVVQGGSLQEAKARSRRLLRHHAQAMRAELFDNERQVATIDIKDAPPGVA